MNPARTLSLQALAAAVAVIAAPLAGAASPPRGSDAPPITLKSLDGAEVSTAKLAPKPLVLIFGETNHDGTKQACADVLDAIKDPRLGAAPAAVLVTARDVPEAQMKEESQHGRFPPFILRDTKREAFGAYRVLVMPSVVVVDGKGKVVHAMPGFLPRFKEILGEALLVASGKETAEQLDQVIAGPAPSADPDAIRAERLTHLGIELARRGVYDAAEARFGEAIALAPTHNGARLGLADLLVRQNRLSDAEPLYRSVLGSNPQSLEAALGLALVQAKRGGDELPKAEAAVRALVEKDPSSARAQYILGLVLETKADMPAALAAFKKAAELALEQRPPTRE